MNSLQNSVSEYLYSRAELVEKFFMNYLADGNYNLYNVTQNVLQSIDDENIQLQILDLEGHIVASTDGFSYNDKPDDFSAGNGKRLLINNKNEMIYTVDLKDNIGEKYGSFRLSVSLEKMRQRQLIYLTVSILAGILVVGLVLMSGMFFIQSIVLPVKNITETAQSIAKGDFSVRIDKKHSDEIGELADSINNMAMDLSKIDKLKNDFISSVSHELRTPLTAIRGWNETITICDPVEENETILKGLDIIDAETQRLMRMVDELLDYSKIQSGKFTISKSKINLHKILMDTIDILGQKILAAEIEIRCKIPTFEMIIIGDEERIKQVFINILDNAVKHSKKNGVIKITFMNLGNGYAVIFKDNGAGIKEEELPFIKERFYKGSSPKPGSGLGLSISDEVVRLHGGSLNIASKEGVGTTVSVELPANIDD